MSNEQKFDVSKILDYFTWSKTQNYYHLKTEFLNNLIKDDIYPFTTDFCTRYENTSYSKKIIFPLIDIFLEYIKNTKQTYTEKTFLLLVAIYTIINGLRIMYSDDIILYHNGNKNYLYFPSFKRNRIIIINLSDVTDDIILINVENNEVGYNRNHFLINDLDKIESLKQFNLATYYVFKTESFSCPQTKELFSDSNISRYIDFMYNFTRISFMAVFKKIMSKTFLENSNTLFNAYSMLKEIYQYLYSSDRIRYFLEEFTIKKAILEDSGHEKVYVRSSSRIPTKDNIVLDFREITDKLSV